LALRKKRACQHAISNGQPGGRTRDGSEELPATGHWLLLVQHADDVTASAPGDRPRSCWGFGE
jgi:hypothetical protein